MLLDIEKLKLWQGNYNEGDIGAIVKSIRKFGFAGVLKVWNNEVRAGNHTLKALLDIKRQGAMPDLDREFPPRGVIIEDGKWLVECADISYMNDAEALAFAIADNRTASLASQDEELLLQYLEHLYELSPSYTVSAGYDDDDIQMLQMMLLSDQGLLDKKDETAEPDDEQADEDAAKSDGSLLQLVDLTIAEPKTVVSHGDVFHLGHHILICAEVISEWESWVRLLDTGMLFCPYPGVFVPLSVKAETTPLLMVQPDTYIAGHICDQYANVKGAEYVKKE